MCVSAGTQYWDSKIAAPIFIYSPWLRPSLGWFVLAPRRTKERFIMCTTQDLILNIRAHVRCLKNVHNFECVLLNSFSYLIGNGASIFLRAARGGRCCQLCYYRIFALVHQPCFIHAHNHTQTHTHTHTHTLSSFMVVAGCDLRPLRVIECTD